MVVLIEIGGVVLWAGLGLCYMYTSEDHGKVIVNYERHFTGFEACVEAIFGILLYVV